MRIARHLLISGRVQGVGYRAWAASVAKRATLSGWVRNRTDGRVEIICAGNRPEVEAFIAECKRGPFAARVSGIEITECELPEETGFTRRDTV
jgi:acylphosphatase